MLPESPSYLDRFIEHNKSFNKFLYHTGYETVHLLWENYAVFHLEMASCNKTIIEFNARRPGPCDLDLQIYLSKGLMSKIETQFQSFSAQFFPENIADIGFRIFHDLKKISEKVFSTSCNPKCFIDFLNDINGDLSDILYTLNTANEQLDLSLKGVPTKLGEKFAGLIKVYETLQESTINSLQIIRDDFKYLLYLPYNDHENHTSKERKLTVESRSLLKFCIENKENPFKIAVTSELLNRNLELMTDQLKKIESFRKIAKIPLSTSYDRKMLEEQLGVDLLNFFGKEEKSLLQFCRKHLSSHVKVALPFELLKNYANEMKTLIKEIQMFQIGKDFTPITMAFDNPLIKGTLEFKNSCDVFRLYQMISCYSDRLVHIYTASTKALGLLHKCQYVIDNPSSLCIS